MLRGTRWHHASCITFCCRYWWCCWWWWCGWLLLLKLLDDMSEEGVLKEVDEAAAITDGNIHNLELTTEQMKPTGNVTETTRSKRKRKKKRKGWSGGGEMHNQHIITAWWDDKMRALHMFHHIKWFLWSMCVNQCICMCMCLYECNSVVFVVYLLTILIAHLRVFLVYFSSSSLSLLYVV